MNQTRPNDFHLLNSIQLSIAIIICTWNRAEKLRATLLSLNNLEYDMTMDLEFIVVDNNSQDETRAVVESLQAEWRPGYLRYLFEPKQGKQFALNTGIKNCHKDILAFTDDDILFPEDWVIKIQQLFISDPELDLAGGRTSLVWPSEGKPCWYHDNMNAILAGVDNGNESLCPPPPQYSPAGSNMFVRRRLFDNVGLFSTTHFRHMDFEFGQRCIQKKMRVAYAADIDVFAPIDTACLTKRYFRRWSFKAGFSHGDEQDQQHRLFLNVPHWVYGEIFRDFGKLIIGCFRKPSADTFLQELKIWRFLGQVISRWYAAVSQDKYNRWQKKYSQKNKNVY